MSDHLDHLPEIPNSATLAEWQTYIGSVCKARGWDKANDLEVFLLFSEEVGEMAKAFRAYRNLFTERILEDRCAEVHSDVGEVARENLAEEMADVLSYLLDLSGRLDLDLEGALRKKERKNRQRTWD